MCAHHAHTHTPEHHTSRRMFMRRLQLYVHSNAAASLAPPPGRTLHYTNVWDGRAVDLSHVTLCGVGNTTFMYYFTFLPEKHQFVLWVAPKCPPKGGRSNPPLDNLPLKHHSLENKDGVLTSLHRFFFYYYQPQITNRWYRQ